jgi:hypothetical protein
MKIEIAVVVHEEPFRFGRKGVGDPTAMADHRGIGGFYHRSTIPTNAAENAARCVDGFDGWCRSFLKTVRRRYGDQLG